MSPDVLELQVDDGNEQEFARHAVSSDELFEVLYGIPVFLRNRRGRSATLLMIGPSSGGRLLTVPLAPTETYGLWRPATAWSSSPSEIARYHAVRRR